MLVLFNNYVHQNPFIVLRRRMTMIKGSYKKLLEDHPQLLNNEDALVKIISDEKEIEAWQAGRCQVLSEKKQPMEWADIGIVFDDPYFMIVRDLVQFPDGRYSGYCRALGQADLKGGRGVVVLPVYQGKILVLHHYRHPTRNWQYEVPRGYGEPNTPGIANARKEVLEETGGEIAEIVELGEMYTNTGFEGGPVSLYFAKLASVGEPNVGEGIQAFAWLPVEEFEKWIAEGKINDGFTIVAYTRAKLRKLLE
jgi:ADP-ribose pyrophosphatase